VSPYLQRVGHAGDLKGDGECHSAWRVFVNTSAYRQIKRGDIKVGIVLGGKGGRKGRAVERWSGRKGRAVERKD
jgi:hypothetical protein